MARGKFQPDIHQEVRSILESKKSFGSSRHDAKKGNNDRDKIYSYSTMKIYQRECQKFAEYVREVSPDGRFTKIEDTKQYAKDYIAMHNADPNYSPYTVKMQRSALAKMYGVEGKTLGAVDERRRSDITRSRNRTVISEKTGKEIKNPTSRAGHFSEKNNREIVEFARGTGLRRSEMERLRGDQLREEGDRAYLEVTGKGGKTRYAEIIGPHKQEIIDRCKEAGHERVWDRVPSNMDVHHYRSQYATEMYNELARDVNEIPKKDRYHCRYDKAGTWYDREAMKKVTNSLGHNRINVIAEHYLRD